ncbi:unnamed protein product [Musa acuminata subsp. malaccensis]|uniref:(wild Malaysian banana) hypothetical protein n=1 Tax=Musa acuminata subsp. malaccensis TaxID=214687 RepID=A0A804HP88_MUSAM|nr:unnamed protein product [Musa acuminata subsp. malaccensis]
MYLEFWEICITGRIERYMCYIFLFSNSVIVHFILMITFLS